MSQALEKWYTKRGRVGQVVAQVTLYAQLPHNSTFRRCCLLTSGAKSSFFPLVQTRVKRKSLVCRNNLLFLYKLLELVPCGNQGHMVPHCLTHFCKIHQNCGKETQRYLCFGVLVNYQGCTLAPPKYATDMTCVDS